MRNVRCSVFNHGFIVPKSRICDIIIIIIIIILVNSLYCSSNYGLPSYQKLFALNSDLTLFF